MIVGALEIQLYADVARIKQDLATAVNSVTGATQSIERAAGLASKALGALGVTLTAGAFVSMIKSTIEMEAHLYSLSVQTGLTVETLSGIKGLAKQAGMDLDSMASIVGKLEKNMLAFAQSGGGKAADAFAQLGLSQADVQKGLRDMDSFLPAFAKRLVETGVGGETAGLAMQLLGKGGASALLFMRALAEQGVLTAKVTTEDAVAAHEFEVNLIKLQSASGSLKIQLANFLLPTLNSVAEAMIRARKEGDGFFGQMIAGLDALRGDDVYRSQKRIFEITGDVLKLENDLLAVRQREVFGLTPALQKLHEQQRDADAKGIQKTLDDLIAERKTLQSYVAEIEKAGAKPAPGQNDPLGSTTAAEDSAALQKTLAHLRLQALSEGLTREKEIRDAFHQNALLSDAQFYDQEASAIDSGLRQQLAVLELNIAEQKQLKAAADKPADRIKATIEVMKAEALMNKAELDADVKRTIAYLARADAERKVRAEIAAQAVAFAELARIQDQARAVANDFTAAQRTNIEQIQFETSLIGKTIAETEQLTAARTAELAVRAALAALPRDSEGEILPGAIDAMNALLLGLDNVKKALADVAADKSFKTYMKSLSDDASNQWRKAGSNIQDSLTKAFGAAGSAVGGMVKAWTDGTAAQIDLDKQRQESIKAVGGDVTALRKIEIDYQNKSLENSLAAFGQMAGAAASYFDKQSDQYKVLHGIEQAFFAVRFALQLKAMLFDATATTASVANSMTRAVASGAAGIAKAFEQMGVWGFIGAAAIVAALAAVGVQLSSGGGSGGGQSAADRQKEQGTGTVLGDSSAKSASIENSLKEIEKTDALGLIYTHDMLSALQSIDRSMAGLAALIARNAGITTGGDFGINTGTVKGLAGGGVGGIVGTFENMLANTFNITKFDFLFASLFNAASKTTVEILDSGIKIAGKVNDLIAGLGMSQYAVVRTHSSSVFGLFQSTSDDEQTIALSERISRQFGLIFAGITDSVEAAAKALDLWSPQFSKDLHNFVVDLGKISLQGLKGQELQDALSAIFSTYADRLASMAFGEADFAQFQKAGEGYFETIIRVATANEYVKQSFVTLGLSLPLLGIEAIKARMNMVDLAGGLEDFGKLTQDYYSKYFSAPEQHAGLGRQLGAEFGALGKDMPTDPAGFRKLVEGLDLTKESEQALFVSLMKLAPAFYDFSTQIVGLDGKMHSLDDVTAQHTDLMERLAVTEGKRTQQEIDRAHELAGAIDQQSINYLNAIYAAEDYNAGIAAQTDRRRNEMSAEIDLMRAQGNEAGALAQQRALDIQGMNDAQIKSYDYIASIRAQIDALNAAAEVQKKTKELLDQSNTTSIELLRAMGLEQRANDAERALAIVGLTAEQIAIYDLNQAMKAQITLLGLQKEALKTETDLKKQLFDLSHTDAEILANNRALKLAELAAQEAAAHLAPGTLTSIQQQVNAQTDLNAAMKATTDAMAAQSSLWEQFATSDMKLAKATQDVHDEFARLGIVVPASKQGFAELVASIDPTTAAGKSLLEALKLIAPAFSVFSGAVATTAGVLLDFSTGYGLPVTTGNNAAADAAKLLDDQLALQAQIYELLGDKAGAAAVLEAQHAIALAKLDPSLRGLTTQLWALQAAAAAAAKAAEFAKAKTDLQIQIERALGHEEIAVALEHANTIADINQQWGAGTDQANELIAMYQQLWAVQGNVVSSTADWIKSLQDWLRNLQLDSTLSPLTANQRFDVAHSQYVEDLLKAQGGDAAARGRVTNDADAYLHEAVAMFGKGSFQYEAIFRAISEQTQGLIDQGLGPSAPATLTDLNATAQNAAQTAKQQMDSLLAKIDTLNAKVESQTQEISRGNDNANLNHEDAQEASDNRSREMQRSTDRAVATRERAPLA